MAQTKAQETRKRIPKGFVQGNGGLASEYAREMGWDLNEDERRRSATDKQDADGDVDHDYGTADLGGEEKKTSVPAVKVFIARQALAPHPAGKPVAVKRAKKAA